nr:uncharacterized protein CI109_005108 [Kwoniella shandongensis]KAA5526534.1 hypothetical protein CI109_005108 [Kwoniella shandongensis]
MSTRRKRSRQQTDPSSVTSQPPPPSSKKATRSSTRKQQAQIQAPMGSIASSSSATMPTLAPPPLKEYNDNSSDMFGDDIDINPDFPEPGIDDDDELKAAIQASLKENYAHSPRTKTKVVNLPSPAPTNDRISHGREGWKRDYTICKSRWGKRGEVEGYAGMVATIHDWKYGDVEDSIKFQLDYEDIDGRQIVMKLEIVFKDLKTYPASYSLVLFSEDKLPRRAETTFSRFADIYDLDIPLLLERLVASLQGDDDATGGVPPDFEDEDEEVEYDADGVGIGDEWTEAPGRGFEVAKGSVEDLGSKFSLLKEHFEQAKNFNYRPGLTRVSDFWVVSYSIPLKNLPIDPNTLGMWDDGLVEAWKDDQRITLLIGTETYPPHLDRMRYWLGFHKDYKPSPEVMVSSTRGQGGLAPFYLSEPLLDYLKTFGRCFKLKTAYSLNWATADRIGMDEDQSNQVFKHSHVPKSTGPRDKGDPLDKGLQNNIPLCAFHWVLRRFMEAPKYCLNCGLQVAVPSLRPYVCNKDLCLYSFMSLGLGPSLEHIIKTHPGVVDILLSFAYSAASSTTRMELPLKLHIVVPPEYGILEPTLFDDLPDQRNALVWLIDQLPKVSEIKAELESGKKLNKIEAPAASIAVLRWVVGSCRAYLKEAKPNEGVSNGFASATYGMSEKLKQFVFVVGSPEQESNFKSEVEAAQKADKNCAQYPTLLAFHGSGADRWHNILRTGLDFNEIECGRAYGNGVYFAPEYTISMEGYARANISHRANADYQLSRATALVELVNVPNTFVSHNPFYVVNNIKQIRPFLLLVAGTNNGDTVAVTTTAPTAAVSKAAQPADKFFKHDPKLKKPTTYNNQPLQVKMPEKLKRTTYIDDEPDDETDYKILHPDPPPAPIKSFKPTLKSRIGRIQQMPPPSETSVVASKALGKEFKTLVKAQGEGKLPFYVDPETDSLYCWLLELHEFPDSLLKTDLKKHKIPSIIAELRFPASFPHSPPFMRILHPRCLPFMQGGGGNITAGGSVCNEILTASGWNPAFCVEAIVRDIMVNMTEATPPARLDTRAWDRPYTLREAIDAYKRVAVQHGWQVPEDFDRLAT